MAVVMFLKRRTHPLFHSVSRRRCCLLVVSKCILLHFVAGTNGKSCWWVVVLYSNCSPFIILPIKQELCTTFSDNSICTSDFTPSTLLKKDICCLKRASSLWARPFLSATRFSSPTQLLSRLCRVIQAGD